jgi:hypothetical protein
VAGEVGWADEFARTFAGGLDLGVDEELERAWKQQVRRMDMQHVIGSESMV